MGARYLLAGLVGAAVALASVFAFLWLMALQTTVVTAAAEAQRARIAAEGVAAIVTGAAVAPRRAPPVAPTRRAP